MSVLSSGPYWRTIVEVGQHMWAAEVPDVAPVRAVELSAGPDGLVVTAEPLGARVGAAWGLTVALGWLVAADRPAFAGVGAVVAVGGLTVVVPAAVLLGVADGQERPWWAARVAMRVG